MKRNNRKGFTTVELVIVIAVIAILATALIPTFGGLIENANKTANEQTVRNVYKAYIADDPIDNTGASYYILVDGKYYKVTEGSLNTTPENSTPADVKCVTVVENDDTAKGFKETVGAHVYGANPTADTECTNGCGTKHG